MRWHLRWRTGPRRLTVIREAGLSGVLMFLGVALLLLATAAIFAVIRPPTVEELEDDIWRDWARLATDSQGRTFIDLLLDNQRAAAQRMLESFGKLIDEQGQQFVVRTFVQTLTIRDHAGAVFAEWRSPAAIAGRPSWRRFEQNLIDSIEGRVGKLEVTYRFYGGGLDALPNIRRLQGLYSASMWLVGVLASLILIAVLANIGRIRERAARLQSQQVTIDLAHQMCHELRNGLWSFSLEGRNLTQLFHAVDDYFRVEPEALAQAARKTGLSTEQLDRLRRHLERALSEHEVHPQTDVLASNAMAIDAYQQIERFSRYINLTVEELDRNLLGARGPWQPTLVSLRDAWCEACELLSMRFKSAGVTHGEESTAEDDVIFGDWRSLVHVFVNLAKNAIEATREQQGQRELRFRTGSDAATIWCTVWNSGAIIPSEHIPRVFHRGFTTKPGAGRGTGLALVRESIEQMRGKISVKSVPGAGTEFRIVFPRPAARNGESANPHEGAGTARG
jgi:signal transduction histidine kinase